MTDRKSHRDQAHTQPSGVHRPADATQLRRLAEAKAGLLKPRDMKTLSPGKIRQTFHELQVHRIELEMQNEELRWSQRELSHTYTQYELTPAVVAEQKPEVLHACENHGNYCIIRFVLKHMLGANRLITYVLQSIQFDLFIISS